VDIEVLYFTGCPGHEALLPRLRDLMARAGVHAEVTLTRIESGDAAERAGFLGSPTVRIDGDDIEPAAAGRNDFGLKCRLYPTADGLRSMPTDELVLDALIRAGGSWRERGTGQRRRWRGFAPQAR
jgi:hypothetical protein